MKSLELRTELINTNLYLLYWTFEDQAFIKLECPYNNLFDQNFLIGPDQAEQIRLGLQEKEHVVTEVVLEKTDGNWFTVQIIPEEPLMVCFGHLGEPNLRLTGDKQEAIQLIDDICQFYTKADSKAGAIS